MKENKQRKKDESKISVRNTLVIALSANESRLIRSILSVRYTLIPASFQVMNQYELMLTNW